MNLRPLGYEPSELPSCSTPRRDTNSTSAPPAPANHACRSRDHPDGDGDGDAVPEGASEVEPDGLGDGLAVGDPVAGLAWAATARLMAACRSFWAWP